VNLIYCNKFESLATCGRFIGSVNPISPAPEADVLPLLPWCVGRGPGAKPPRWGTAHSWHQKGY